MRDANFITSEECAAVSCSSILPESLSCVVEVGVMLLNGCASLCCMNCIALVIPCFDISSLEQ